MWGTTFSMRRYRLTVHVHVYFSNALILPAEAAPRLLGSGWQTFPEGFKALTGRGRDLGNKAVHTHLAECAALGGNKIPSRDEQISELRLGEY